MEIFGEEYQRLAMEIIVLASKDYRAALKLRKKNPKSKKAATAIAEIEEFFHSKWYGSLTEVPSEIIIKKLREEVEEQ